MLIAFCYCKNLVCFNKKLSTEKAAIPVIEVLLTSEFVIKWLHEAPRLNLRQMSLMSITSLLIVLVECTWKIFQPGCAASGEINRVEFGHLTLKANECSCRLLSAFQNRSWNYSELWFYSKLDFWLIFRPKFTFPRSSGASEHKT